MTDKELKKLVGKPYTRENSKKLIYGGRVDSKGTIVEVITSKDKRNCKLSKRIQSKPI